MDIMEIDGSTLEGGGQILRLALSLSCLFQKAVRITKIRAGRSKPGLAAQHLKGVELLRDMCNARVKGAVLGSTELEFSPQKISGGKYYADTGTAGSVALLLQVALPVAHFSNKTTILDLKGGTNATFAPQMDYMTEILRPNLEKFGPTFDFELFRRGYFPKGGGHCEVTIRPVKNISAVTNIEFGRVNKYYGWSFVAGTLHIKMAHEITDGAKSILKNVRSREEPLEIESYKETQEMANGNCSEFFSLGCETSTGCILGGSSLGNRGEKPFETGKKAATEVEECVRKNACVDSYTQDQLIIYMALASGVSKIKSVDLTLHSKTAIYIVELMTKAKFNVRQESDGCLIECAGVGFVNNSI